MLRIALIVLFALNAVLAFAAVVLLPGEIAIHFGAGGAPNDWGSSWVHVVVLLVVELPLFVFFYHGARLLSGKRRRWIALPNRDYWLDEANRRRFASIFNARIWEYGALFFAFMLLVKLLTLDANLADPVRLEETPFLLAVAAFLGYTLIWVVRLLRALRIPGK